MILLDSIDRKLISILCENARMPASELARNLAVSRSTVLSRLQRLEKQQIIKGYTIKFGSEYEKRLVTSHVLVKLNQ